MTPRTKILVPVLLAGLVAGLVTVVVAVSLSSAPDKEARMPPPRTPTADSALRFGAIVPTPTTTVLAVRHDAGIDEYYQAVLSIAPGEVGTLLSGSGFSTTPTPDYGPFQTTLDGYDLDVATDVVSAEDSLPPAGDRRHTVIRQVVVDRTDPTKSIVHLRMFTT